MISSTKESRIQGAQILSEVWREACRHLELDAALISISRRLQDHLPVARLHVFDLDRHRQVLAVVSSEGVRLSDGEALTSTTSRRLTAWIESGEVATVAELRQDSPSVARALPRNSRPDALLGGLAGVHGARGLLLVEVQTGAGFKQEHRRIVTALLEPLSVALDNHHQVRELIGLRAAAEADRQSLLTRLGRDAMSDTVVGANDGLKGVFDRVAKVCTADLPVLILGETGSGKEVIAREIHTRSPRAGAPFIRVNCGAIPPELIDSELFGHEKGSFTGATSQRLGWFERAHLGTLFLDEVGELPLAAQVRLLRVLQDGLIQRVGGAGDVPVDVRIVAATHRDLPRLIQEGKFREDLWYRLATFPIALPPLRERRGDVAALAAHFARRAANRFGLKLQLPTPEDLALLGSYDWPGNVRELAAVMDRATIMGEGEHLAVAKALGSSLSTTGTHAPGASLRETPPVEPLSHAAPVTLDEAMRAHIERTLALTHGRIEGRHGAARILAINPHTLRARMRKLGIDWARFKSGEA